METRFSFCPKANRAEGVTRMEIRLAEIAVALNLGVYADMDTGETYVITYDSTEQLDLERRLHNEGLVYRKSMNQ